MAGCVRAVTAQLATRDVCRTWGGVAPTRRRSAECVGRKRYCRRAARAVIRTRHPAGDSGTGDVPHWSSTGRAEDWPGNASTGKAPGKTSRELGSAVIRAPFDIPRRASEKVAGAGASGKAREEEKSPAPPQPSISLWQHCRQERTRAVCACGLLKDRIIVRMRPSKGSHN
ncbi:hypothetical protein NDU88_008328 [Pleurodeles waltl]|uniref:Uncharacterized protein n=1 Tax=Pleurodeles waltl TaxID=8319 RepID=A0AAV7RWJ5_PLEWA|nr:hypothetical protein NDU88_008328 [Pleurodeles waltl]